jgi:hypothetical protein
MFAPVEVIIYLVTLLGSLSIVSSAGNAGFLNSAFQRGFAGVSTQIVSSNFLLNYTNTESFIRACYEGEVGFTGFVFIFSLAVLIITWVSNLIDYKQAIV